MCIRDSQSDVQGVDYYELKKLNSETEEYELVTSIKELAELEGVSEFDLFDEHPHIGTNYYKVVAHLKDGSTKTSEVKKATFNQLEGVVVYPNPASADFTILLRNLDNTPTTILVNDLAGKTLQTIQTDGTNQKVVLSADKFPTGQYFIQVMAEGKEVITEPIIIQH